MQVKTTQRRRRTTPVAGTRARQRSARPEGSEPVRAEESAPEASPPKVSALREAWRSMSVKLAVGAVVLLALGSWFAVEYHAASGGDAVRNLAMVDTATTAEVSGEVRQALEQTFSYRFDDPKATEQAADRAFVGKAVGQYERLFASVREQAPAQRLELRAKATFSGVRLLDGDRAMLLVFLDQSATRGDTGASSTGGAQLSVSAQRIDDRWRISDLRAH